MSTVSQTRALAIEAAERRVLENVRMSAAQRPPSQARRLAVLTAAAALFAITFAARLAIKDPGALIANFYVVPIALIAIEFGARAGVAAAALAFGLVFAWAAIQTVDVGALGYTARGAALLVTGAVVGRFSERLRNDIAERQRVERSLSLYADQLARANEQLGQSVERLEAFAEIARAVGGETELERVLSLILAHGREIVTARSLLVCLPEGEQLVAVRYGERQQDALPLRGSLVQEVLSSGRPLRVSAQERPGRLDELVASATHGLLVPIIFRGETLGVLAGIDRGDGQPFTDEDEQLLVSVAASAATAVATARSVAAERLRLSIDAAEQARGRWARELHDQTLQGLTGARMVLAAGLAREDAAALRRAAQAADAHIGVEVRNLRDLITELRPAALDDLGLGPAIESLAKRQAAAAGVTLEMDIELGAHERPREVEDAIYRIVQEALSNVARHAQAERATLSVRQLRERMEVTVQDDGCGFAPDGPSEGFGLIGMRERAHLLGGQLSLASREGGPTRVSAVLPLPV
ncbi:MAG TPA: GAF domain-containing sensor histidine kinase [Solirubrobacteraceae bacterium]|nr:GAF domain-containing sensor histidine kinase [Solirubrobacteraceae bacterium]